MTILRNDEWLFNLSRGKVPGHSFVDKFGHAAGVGTSVTTIWPKLTVYTYSTTANIDSISSSNAGDTEVIRIVGLDTSWNVVTQDITLTGQAVVNLTTPLIRVFTMYNEGTVDLLGDVHLYINGATVVAGVPTVAIEIRAVIINGDNRTLQVPYSIPNGFTGYLVHRDQSASKGQDVDFRLKIREFGKVFQIRHVLDMNNNLYEHQSLLTNPISAKSDIEITSATSAGTTNVSASYLILLVQDGY